MKIISARKQNLISLNEIVTGAVFKCNDSDYFNTDTCYVRTDTDNYPMIDLQDGFLFEGDNFDWGYQCFYLVDAEVVIND